MNWLLSGAAILLLGVLVMLAAGQLGGPGRLAQRVIVLTGVFSAALGLVGYALEPRRAVLVFTVPWTSFLAVTIRSDARTGTTCAVPGCACLVPAMSSITSSSFSQPCAPGACLVLPRRSPWHRSRGFWRCSGMCDGHDMPPNKALPRRAAAAILSGRR